MNKCTRPELVASLEDIEEDIEIMNILMAFLLSHVDVIEETTYSHMTSMLMRRYDKLNERKYDTERSIKTYDEVLYDVDTPE